MRVALVLLLVACGGHKSVNTAPGGGGAPGSGSSDPFDTLGDDDGAGGGELPGGGKVDCPPGYSRSGDGGCVPTPTGVGQGKGCKADPGDPMGAQCEKGPTGWPVDGDLHVVGAIPKDAIHRTIRSNFTDLRACYEQVLLANPGVEGRVLVKFKVGIDGAVTDVTATGVHPDLETCIVDKVRKLRFPKPDNAGSVEVTYPFVFKAG